MAELRKGKSRRALFARVEPRRRAHAYVRGLLARAYAMEHLGERDGVLVVDETGFLKKGPAPMACSVNIRVPLGGSRTVSWVCPCLRHKQRTYSDRPRALPAEVLDR